MTANSPSWHPAALILLQEDGRTSSARRKTTDFGTFWTAPRVRSYCELQHLPGFGAMPVLDTPRQMIHGSKSSVLLSQLPRWGGKMRRRSGGTAATPLLGSGFNYLPAKVEQGFMLGKSLSNLEDLIRMENAPERGIWNHSLQGPSADLRQERTARARRGGEVPERSGKGEVAILGIRREMKGNGRRGGQGLSLLDFWLGGQGGSRG